MRFGVVGRTRLLLDAAELAVRAGHEIAFVYTCRSESFYGVGPGEFASLADRHEVPFYDDTAIVARLEDLLALRPDLCLSLNWLTRLPRHFLESFPLGVLNSHAGDLPRYRGNACPNWAILNFETRVGLTIHAMTEALDAGPIVVKKYLDIDERTYIGDIYDWLSRETPLAFVEALTRLGAGPGALVEQDPSIRPLRTYPRKPEDARIDWSRGTRDILALIRASSHPFDGAFCALEDGSRVIVFRAEEYCPDHDFCAVPGQVCERVASDPVVATGDGMIRLTECRVDDLDGEEAMRRVTRSLRNRLL